MKVSLTMLSPNQAAKIAGVSRTTINNLISDKKLKAQRDNRGHWKIAPEDLEIWMKNKGESVTEMSVSEVKPEAAPSLETELHSIQVEVASLRAEIKGKDELIEQLRSDLAHARLPWWKRWK